MNDEGLVVEVPLTQGLSALVDVADFHLIVRRTWCSVGGYAMTRWQGGHKTMHRLILGLEKGDPREGDHINGNRVDNRRCNLRIVAQIHNRQNRGRVQGTLVGAKGVSWHADKQRYFARIRANGRQYNLGYFRTVEEASDAYEAAAAKHFGEFNRALEYR
jgi:AP2 domain